MISIAVVDDNDKETKAIKSLIDESAESFGEEFQVDYFSDSLKFFETFKDNFDIVFLDIDMPLMDGMSLAQNIRKTGSGCCIVFITNMPQYAIQGYQVEATSYLLKPVNFADFRKVMQKAVSRVEEARKRDVNIAICGRNGVRVFAASKIKYIEVAGHMLVYHTLDGDITDRGALKDVEKALGNANFSRCNNCYLVNFKFVDLINNNIVRVSGAELPISRSKKKEFVEKYMQFTRL